MAVEKEINMPFTDVKQTDWFYESIQYAYNNDLMVGVTDTTFEPSTQITRSMIITILYRLDGSPEISANETFTDVAPDAWYANAIEWANANNLISGYSDNRFGPNDSITREELATTIYNYAKYKGYDVSKQNDLSVYDDIGEVHNKEAIAWANAVGLINGITETTLNPQGNTTRAQLATILTRLCRTVLKNQKLTQETAQNPQGIFTVTFKFNDSSKNDSSKKERISVVAGEKVRQPETPKRIGYCFNGWYTEEKGGQEFDFNTAIDKNITLYAHWEIDTNYNLNNRTRSFSKSSSSSSPITSYTVAFYINDDTDAVMTYPVKIGNKVSEPAPPTREGYIFEGWYSDVDLKIAYDFDSVVKQNLNLYAKWSVANTKCTVNFYMNDDTDTVYKTIEVSLGDKITMADDPTREGYTFDGWYSDAELKTAYNFESAVTQNLNLYAKWDKIIIDDEDDSDNDGVPYFIEEFFGTDPEKDDTDGDGLSDYIEIYELGLDPTKVDTDDNGISDADEDSDGDGLTNIEELRLGTSLITKDTDNDGLSDYEEVKVYHTDPLNPDTDGDGIIDGDEIKLGQDPLSTTSISSIYQTLGEECIDDALLTDNEAIPSISGTADTVINNSVYMDASKEISLDDNRAVIGKGVDLTIEGNANLQLKFDINGDTSSLVIMRLDEEEGWVSLEDTVCSEDSVSANVTQGGTYCVMDLEILLPYLGINIDDYYNAIMGMPTALSDDVPVETLDNEETNKKEIVEEESKEETDKNEEVKEENKEEIDNEEVKKEESKEEIDNEEVKKEESKEEIDNEEVKEEESKEEIDNEEVKEEESKEEIVQKEIVYEETSRENILDSNTFQRKISQVGTYAFQRELLQESLLQNDVNQEEVIQEEAMQEEIIQEDVDQEEADQEEADQEEADQEETTQEEADQEEATQEETTQEETDQEEVTQKEVSTESVDNEVEKENKEEVKTDNDATGSVVLDDTINTLIDENAGISMMALSDIAMGQADIVFAIDTTGSMSEEISNVANTVIQFAHNLTSTYNVNANFALVDYRDITVDGLDSTSIIQNGTSNWYTTTSSFKDAVSRLTVSGGGDTPETAIDALECARQNVNFRHSASKFIVLVTDADYKVDNNYSVSSMDEEIDRLVKDGITVSVITTNEYKNAYKDLYEKTGGICADIYGDFSEELLTLADKIGEEVNEGNWILLDDYQYVSLNKPLAPDSGDTDEDGWSDWEELETPVKKVLTPEIRRVLSSRGIAEELIKEYYDLGYIDVSILVFPYKSNPILKDTDFDGKSDPNDVDPKSNHFKGQITRILKSDEEPATGKIEFTMDYRNFFENNSIYKKDLGIVSSLLSADIYDGVYVEVTDGAMLTGNNSPEKFLNLLGMEDITVEKIKVPMGPYPLGVSGDEMDVTEIALGHHKVTYKGETKDIIALAVRGTNGTFEEWSSNFDVGADTTQYTNLTGSHSMWKDKNNHKGFDVATNRAKKIIDEYIANLDSENKVIWITGHSRGGAISNILGKMYEDDSSITSFTYTFACPNTTLVSEDKARSYRSIFNIVNSDDLIPTLPLAGDAGWGYTKYGRTEECSVGEKYRGKRMVDAAGLPFYIGTKGSFKEFLNIDYKNAMFIDSAHKAFKKMANSRDDIYVYLKEDNTIPIQWLGINHFSKTKAIEDKTNFESSLSQTFKQLCNVEVYEVKDGLGVDKYRAGCQQTPAYVMQTIALMAAENAKGETKFEGMKLAMKAIDSHKVAWDYEWARNTFLLMSVTGLEHPHWTESYYLITRNENFKFE